MRGTNYIKCKRCERIIVYDENETFWDDNYHSCSAKLVRCDICDAINVIKYEEDRWIKELTEEEY